ncbi:hypothetical protein G6L28_07980 [Agrobacterium larrymoorei]|uniref:hypothetical protein n=1 Tax=Agrobacterium larrymoorei TaxID=160699 RepID=UPI001573A760|nr:hypothetical protein [Agrobacterium larrymoorei]NTJ42536.1 hypothetical protein [Agrobacterium larrymoorei]
MPDLAGSKAAVRTTAAGFRSIRQVLHRRVYRQPMILKAERDREDERRKSGGTQEHAASAPPI